MDFGGLFTAYVAFDGAEKTKVYQKAVEYENYGQLVILNEGQFFDILDRNGTPPAKKSVPSPNIIIMPATNSDELERNQESASQYYIAKKRMKNAMHQGFSTDNAGGIMSTSQRMEAAVNFVRHMLENTNYIPTIRGSMYETCDNCDNLSNVHICDRSGNTVIRFCNDCNNKLMAQLIGVNIPDNIPKELILNLKGKTYKFNIEVEIYLTCKVITATEIGKTKRKTDVRSTIDEDFFDMLEILKKRVKKLVSVKYMRPDGYMANSKAIGYIEYSNKRHGYDIVIDGRPYTWDELEKNLSMHGGWKIKIEFGDIGEELD